MLARREFVSIFALVAVVGCGDGGASVKPKPQDTTPPVITAGPTVRFLTQSSATITWSTDDPSSSVVLYSTDLTFGISAGDSEAVTDHSVALPGLTAGTEYHFRVQSINAVDLTTISVVGTFSTLPGPPPPTSLVVYASNAAGNSELYRMNSDGTNQVRLTYTAYEDMYPALSPDRTKIAYVAIELYGDGTAFKNIMIMNSNGTGVKALTVTTLIDLHPCWSPDGTRIAFSRYIDGQKDFEIFSMGADGTDIQRITYEDGRDDEPSWSPDGTKIAFVGMRDGNTEVFVMNADGSVRTPLTQDSVWVYTPRWSPDGTRIAYVREYVTDQGTERDIAIINADGSNPVRVTHNPSFATAVCWDPDGTHLVYASWFPADIHRIEVDGSNDVNLTNSTGREVQPDCR